MLVVMVLAVVVAVVMIAVMLVLVAAVVAVGVVAATSSVALGVALGYLFSGCCVSSVWCVRSERWMGVVCAVGGSAVGVGWVCTEHGVGVVRCVWYECCRVDVG